MNTYEKSKREATVLNAAGFRIDKNGAIHEIQAQDMCKIYLALAMLREPLHEQPAQNELPEPALPTPHWEEKHWAEQEAEAVRALSQPS